MPIYQIASFRCRATEANVSSGSKTDIPLIPSNVRFRTLTSYSITSSVSAPRRSKSASLPKATVQCRIGLAPPVIR